MTKVAVAIAICACGLLVGTSEARVEANMIRPAGCKAHHGWRFCEAVSNRKTIRALRRLVRVEEKRVRVTHPIPGRRLSWDLLRLTDGNHWVRHHLAWLRKRPTWREPIPHQPQWLCIHSHEGAWPDDGAPYYGGLQMDRGFMESYGADMIQKYGGYANLWSPEDQMIVAERAYRSRGYSPWPNTARMCHLLR